MRLQGLTQQSLKKIAQEYVEDRIIKGVRFSWDPMVGWVWEKGGQDGELGLDLNVSNDELYSAYLDTPISFMDEARKSADSLKEYWADVRAIAEEIKDEVKSGQMSGDEVYGRVHENVDGSQWIIYYGRKLDVLQSSSNSDAIDNAGVGIDTSKGWQNILTQVAYFAMVQDVMDELESIGYDGFEGFDGEEEEEF